METEQKIRLVKEVALPLFESGADKDSIMVACIQAGLIDKGLAFTEIPALVKNVGENNGFILTVEQRRDLARDYLSTDGLTAAAADYESLVEYIQTVRAHSGTPEKWTNDLVRRAITEAGLEVPRKSEITAWQQAVADAFRENPDVTKAEIADVIEAAGIKNSANYANQVFELCRALIA